ncbi:MAG TPA: flagellar protein FlgN [Noviherbaspirillum sp.]|jgi:flagella synthesis protein FlgN|uniref:flagella synthesis protein FlgN n=1 Tax=Noviherbaspirillum sp. TaxID=1926288 RepID=UPI002F93D98E
MQQTGNVPMLQFGEEINAGKALLALLQQEQDCLVAADLDALGALAEEKTRLLARLGELAQARQRALAAAGLEDSEAGMQACLKAAPAAVRAEWDALMDIARDGKELNRVNGLLIGQHMARNNAALNALQGGDAPAGQLYGPDGQSASSGGSRRLVVG